MGKKKDDPRTIERFNQIMTLSENSEAWRAQHAAARAKQRGSTGVYNPKSGERDYGGFHSGPKKDMRGRRYRG